MNLLHRLNPWRPRRRKWAILALLLAASPFFAWLYYKLGEVNHPDYGAEMLALVEANLPPEGRDPNQPNAWDILQAMLAAADAADQTLGHPYDTSYVKLNFDAGVHELKPGGPPLATPDESVDALERVGFFLIAADLSHCKRSIPPIIWRLESDPRTTGWTRREYVLLFASLAALGEHARRQCELNQHDLAVQAAESMLAVSRVLAVAPTNFDQAFSGGSAFRSALVISGLATRPPTPESMLTALADAIDRQDSFFTAPTLINMQRLVSRSEVAWVLDTSFRPRLPLVIPWGPVIMSSEREQMG